MGFISLSNAGEQVQFRHLRELRGEMRLRGVKPDRRSAKKQHREKCLWLKSTGGCGISAIFSYYYYYWRSLFTHLVFSSAWLAAGVRGAVFWRLSPSDALDSSSRSKEL